MEDRAFSLKLDYRGGYKFAVDYGMEGVPEHIVDEPAPIGDGEGPTASRMLAAAVAQCLASSLIFCLKKARVELRDLGVEVTARTARNEKGRIRLPGMTVRLTPDLAPEDMDRFHRCTQLFEDFCTVSQSVRQGIDIAVELEPVSPPQPAQTPA